MNSSLLFVDAGFLSELSKHFGKGNYLKFDYLSFFKFLTEKINLNLEKVFYYTAPPYQSENPSKEETLRKKGYDSFINKLKKDKLILVREGRVQKIIGSQGDNFSQKGVDTLMTMDLAFAKDNFSKVKEFILLTSDTDFVPVIKKLREFGIKIILYTYFEKKRNSKFFLSHHLTDCCDKVYYLKKQDMENFLLKKGVKDE